MEDVAPTVNNLKLKALARVRGFLLERIHGLKSPGTNIQIKQNLMLKYSFFYEFLLRNPSPEVDLPTEVRTNYVETMSKKYHTYFKRVSRRVVVLLCGR